MRKIVTVSAKGQITIGKKLLNVVGWQPGERLMWTIRKDRSAQLERVSIVAETAGSLARYIPKDKQLKR
jgi:bifunctional DNA-binding transcriptional regulator/antitoxin component of YhaV-PrlF toxin-antitoxin module